MRADRLLSILLLLQTRGRVTASKLADMLEVSERTIYRDLDALSAAGIPVYAERGPGGGCTLTEGYRTNLTGLTEAEARTLFISTLAGPMGDLGLGKAREDALLKLLAALPSVQQQHAEHARERILLDPVGWFQHREDVTHLATVQAAVWAERKLRIEYRRADGVQYERTIDPYGLVAKTSIWYLVGASAEGLRVYRVSRILNAVIGEEGFTRPSDFDLATFWRESSMEFENTRAQYVVRARIAPVIVRILPEIFGESIEREIERAGPADEQGWITMPLTFDNIHAAQHHMLGFGAQVEVLEPLELRENIIEIAQKIVQFYLPEWAVGSAELTR